MNDVDKVAIRPDVDSYQPARTASGAKSYHSGDDVAVTLAGASLDEVYKLAGKALVEKPEALRTKYGHLNDGMQRMNLGNRIRGVITKMEKTAAGTGTKFLKVEGAFIRDAVAKRAAAAPKAAPKVAAKAKAPAKTAKVTKGKKAA